MNHFIIRVVIPRDRILSGWMYVEKDGKLLHRFSVLGMGNRGDKDTQLWEDGNTPTGTYEGTAYEPTPLGRVHSYGPYGRIRLKPISGNALEAHDLFGRRGLLIHGGDLTDARSRRGAGELRPTLGCLRLHNEDMRILGETLMIDFDRRMSLVRPDVEIIVTEN